jgi:hypothetical protein
MKQKKLIIWSLILMTVVAAVYRVIPDRPFGFAPQWALALFSGVVIKDKKWAFVLPVLSMIISDLLYQVLYIAGFTPIYGFYQGMWLNYLLFASIVVFGFFIKKTTVVNVFAMSLIAPTYFFIVSNFLTWAGVGDYVEYPKTWTGLMECYAAGVPFYRNSLIATLVFSAVLFGSWYFINKRAHKTATA